MPIFSHKGFLFLLISVILIKIGSNSLDSCSPQKLATLGQLKFIVIISANGSSILKLAA